jgi:HD-like signal output (HDOD) protein
MRRILFVDDEPHVLKGLERMLHPQRREWDMVFVGDAEAALAALAAAPFDVLVSDMRMPRMDGTALLTAVQARFPQVVRIVLSGHTELEAALRAVPVAHVFLTKPCDPDTLRRTVDRACSLQALLGDETLRRGIACMTSLPTLPRTYAAVSRALVDLDVPLRAVARIVEQDVGMCAKVLRLVNSGFFGLPRRVTSIEGAIGLLGTNTLKNLVLSAELFGTEDAGAGVPGLPITALQRHALLAAGIARRLLTDAHAAEDAFMAGMLHDVGVLVLMSRRPEHLGRLLAAAREANRPLHEVEREREGVTHAEVGAYLLGLWGLPYRIVEAVAHHHEPARVEREDFDVLGAVHVANGLAHEQAGGWTGGASALDLAYLARAGVAERLAEWRALAARQAAAPAAA